MFVQACMKSQDECHGEWASRRSGEGIALDSPDAPQGIVQPVHVR